MLSVAAELAAHPLARDCLLGCAAVFVVAALFDALAPRHGSGKLQTSGLWLLRGGWVLLTTMLAYQGLKTHSLPIASAAEVLLSIAWGVSGLALFLDLTFNHRLPTWAIAGTRPSSLNRTRAMKSAAVFMQVSSTLRPSSWAR